MRVLHDQKRTPFGATSEFKAFQFVSRECMVSKHIPHAVESNYDFRAEGAFRLTQIAYSISKKGCPTGYTDIL